MKTNKHYENSITPRSEDYSQWYHDVISAADLAEHSSVRGCMIIKPAGYALWEATQKILDEKFKETGVENAYFPMLIPQSLLTKEEEHVEGFAPEVALVTKGGGKDLDEPLALRPTSETIIYEAYSEWIQSYRDLPVLINQWANVFRWEARTRMFLRTTEFLWQEGHTVHATQAEADLRAREMLEIYREFAEDYMAIPVTPGQKTESEKFAGALHTYTVEAMMQDGKALQYATSHNLGDNFAKAFEIEYLDENNEMKHAWQTSWGLSTRSIGGLIMSHSDDKGLVLPPKIAPTQVVIVPIFKTEEQKNLVLEKVSLIKEVLAHSGVRVKTDARDNMRPGEKFFYWEKKGVPLRMELGPRDIEENAVMVARRDNGEKTKFSVENLVADISNLLDSVQKDLFQKAFDRKNENTVRVDSWDDFKKAIASGKFVIAHWDGTEASEEKIKDETKATIRCIPFSETKEEGSCVFSGNPSSQRVLFARSY